MIVQTVSYFKLHVSSQIIHHILNSFLSVESLFQHFLSIVFHMSKKHLILWSYAIAVLNFCSLQLEENNFLDLLIHSFNNYYHMLYDNHDQFQATNIK